MAKTITVEDFRRLRESGAAHAPIDVREPAEYNLSHIPNVYSLPRRWLEFRMRAFVPFLGTPVVVVDDDGRRSELAAATIEHLGYTNVSVLRGGTNRWAADDQPTEWGMNVPSKDFGERYSCRAASPRSRRTSCMPGRSEASHLSLSIPARRRSAAECASPGPARCPAPSWACGSELGDGEETPMVFHCAGRTRSIIGAGTLLRRGARNVFALKNGTSGWRLSGFELERFRPGRAAGADAGAPPRGGGTRPPRRPRGRRALRPREDLGGLKAQAGYRNVYLVDVRNREEYLEGHIPGFRWAPGGQLVRDRQLPRRREQPRRPRLRRRHAGGDDRLLAERIGFADIVVLDGGTSAWTEAGNELESGMAPETPVGLEAARAQTKLISPAELNRGCRRAGSFTPAAATSSPQATFPARAGFLGAISSCARPMSSRRSWRPSLSPATTDSSRPSPQRP